MGKTPQALAESKRVADEERKAIERRNRSIQIAKARALQPKRASGRTKARNQRASQPLPPLQPVAPTHVPVPPVGVGALAAAFVASTESSEASELLLSLIHI